MPDKTPQELWDEAEQQRLNEAIESSGELLYGNRLSSGQIKAATPTQPPDKHQRSSEEVITVLADHWLKGHSLNLGQYKAQYQCACGEVLIEDGHAEDYRSSITQIHRRHVASAIEAIIARTNRESRIDELKQLLPGKKPVGEPILVTIHNRIAALESQQEASNERQCCKR